MTDYPGFWHGVCENCLTNFSAIPHPNNAKNFPGPEDWAEQINCPVCRKNLEWTFNTLGGTK